MFPNDDEENDRLDLYHHIQTLSLEGELHLAPIGPDPQRILGMTTVTLSKGELIWLRSRDRYRNMGH
jgi:hypothetical protein